MNNDRTGQNLRIQRHYQRLSAAEVGFNVGKHIGFVAKNSLCTGCATCEAVCPTDAVQVRYNSGKGIYEPCVDDALCTQCELCVMVCPGFELDLYERPESQKALPCHPLVGPHRGIWRACSLDVAIRDNGASGGMVTQILCHLLSVGEVDGAIVTRMNPAAPLEALSYIAHTRDELIAAQKSKYCPVPLNQVLKPIIRGEDHDRRLAFVGLPAHVHGLRLLQRVYPDLRNRLPYVLSLFTSHVPSRRATEFLCYKQGVRPEDLAQLEYRGEGVPGRLRLVLKDGTERFVNHLDWTYWGHTFPYFFYPVREWLYFDKLSEWADFSVGDNWQGGLGRPHGTATVITRSDAAEQIVRQMLGAELIQAAPMGVDDVVRDQGLTKKMNIGIRLSVWRRLGRKVPIYTHDLPIRRVDFLRTLRFSLNVLMGEHALPFWLLDKIISFDYLLKQLGRQFQRGFSLLARMLKAFALEKRPPPQRSRSCKVVMIGGFGAHDIGDEAMPHADRLNLKTLLENDVEIVMLSHDPAYTAAFHGERAVHDVRALGLRPGSNLKAKIVTLGATLLFLVAALAERYGLRLRLWTSARLALDEIASADMLFNVGGGNLNSVIPQELYKKCTQYLAARILGKTVIVSGQTIGPFTDRLDAWYARLCLDRVHMITFRDKHTSHQRLRAIGVSMPEVLDAADDAMTIPCIPAREAGRVLLAEAGQDWLDLETSLAVAMNLKGSLKVFKGQGRQPGLEREISLMAQIADGLVRGFNAKILFIPTDYCQGVDDREIHREIVAGMAYPEHARCVEGEYDDSTLKGLIGLFDLALGARYHFTVFSASMRIPFVGLASGVYQQTKLKGLADLCGLPQCFVQHDMEFACYEEVWLQVQSVVQTRAAIREQLERVVPELEDRSTIAVREAAKLLKAAAVDH
ncbi:MAG: polysaccharide pyruvyl transferase family protein [Thermoflexales bacterium]|nr:polysaccharide pyruvyl transferase family protein [Thermoflexales bacterium]